MKYKHDSKQSHRDPEFYKKLDLNAKAKQSDLKRIFGPQKFVVRHEKVLVIPEQTLHLVLKRLGGLRKRYSQAQIIVFDRKLIIKTNDYKMVPIIRNRVVRIINDSNIEHDPIRYVDRTVRYLKKH